MRLSMECRGASRFHRISFVVTEPKFRIVWIPATPFLLGLVTVNNDYYWNREQSARIKYARETRNCGNKDEVKMEEIRKHRRNCTMQNFSNFPDEISKRDEKQGIIRGKIIRESFMRFHQSDVCGGFWLKFSVNVINNGIFHFVANHFKKATLKLAERY